MNIYELSGSEHDDNYNLTTSSATTNLAGNTSATTTTSVAGNTSTSAITTQNGFYSAQS